MVLEAIKDKKRALVLLILLILATIFLRSHYVGIRAVEKVASNPCQTSVVDWRNVSLDEMSPEDMMNYFLWPNRTSCRLAHDFGGEMKRRPSGLDGQKAVCLDPGQVAPPPDKCLVYSFGISNEWSFDENMERYGCEVYAFDPSMKEEDHDHSPAIHFLKLGISYRDRTGNQGWSLRSLTSIYNMLKERHGERVIDYLKMDIEYEEWAVIPQIVASGMLDKIRQLAIEIHLSVDNSPTKMRDCVRIIRSIEEGGMVRFDSKINPWTIGRFQALGLSGPQCYEIAWYNSKFLNGASS